MRQSKGLLGLAIMLGLMALPMGQDAAAERYIGLYGGLTTPELLQNVRGIEGLSGITLTDLSLARSTIYGAKLGVFPNPKSSLGLETEFFYTSPHIKQQDITFTFSGLSTPPINFSGAHVRVATWALNLIARYPGERFQPYAGVGFGIFWARISGDPATSLGTSADCSPGLNAQAGIRISLTRRLGLFGEYKYNQSVFEFGRTVVLHTFYQAHHFVGGFSFKF
jgi:opacity protein-like surface antigen